MPIFLVWRWGDGAEAFSLATSGYERVTIGLLSSFTPRALARSAVAHAGADQFLLEA
jgi:hypothetical protein